MLSKITHKHILHTIKLIGLTSLGQAVFFLFQLAWTSFFLKLRLFKKRH